MEACTERFIFCLCVLMYYVSISLLQASGLDPHGSVLNRHLWVWGVFKTRAQSWTTLMKRQGNHYFILMTMSRYVTSLFYHVSLLHRVEC